MLKTMAAGAAWRLFQIVVFFAGSIAMFKIGFENMALVYGGGVVISYAATMALLLIFE